MEDKKEMPKVISANCIDCQVITTQDFKCKHIHDDDYTYVCRRCGCENNIIDRDY